MKPLIGLVPLYDRQKDSYWMLPGYMQGLEEAGAVPVMLPLTQDPEEIGTMAERFDGFLFTGGQDVEPSFYGEEKKETCGETCRARDGMEQLLLKEALRLDRPVFGICRGIQSINAALGGTLYQDIPTEYVTGVEHHAQPPYDQVAHDCFVEKGSALWKIVQKSVLHVNSYHHQAIKELAPGLRVAARAVDGLIEGVYMPDQRFVLAVQWHPEFSYPVREDSRKILRGFVEACEEAAAEKESK